MQSSKLEPDAARCDCGRGLGEAFTSTYDSTQGRLAFHRCQCGREWTERLSHTELADPVSTDELIEVHQRLAQLEGPLSELLQRA